MTEGQTIYSLAGEAYEALQRVQRGDGESIVTLKEGHQESNDWIYELVFEAHGHGDFLPDDWRYETIHSALAFIHDNESEDASEFADGNVDTYNGARSAWLSSHIRRAGYCDQAQEDGLVGEDADIMQRIGIGQYMESEEVFGSVLESLQARLDSLCESVES